MELVSILIFCVWVGNIMAGLGMYMRKASLACEFLLHCGTEKRTAVAYVESRDKDGEMLGSLTRHKNIFWPIDEGDITGFSRSNFWGFVLSPFGNSKIVGRLKFPWESFKIVFAEYLVWNDATACVACVKPTDMSQQKNWTLYTQNIMLSLYPLPHPLLCLENICRAIFTLLCYNLIVLYEFDIVWWKNKTVSFLFQVCF